MNDNKRKLYDALSQDYDLGTFEQFESDIADAGKRRKLYDATIEEYDFGDFSAFENQLGFGEAQIADTAKQAMQKPRGGENGYTFTAEELGVEDKAPMVDHTQEEPRFKETKQEPIYRMPQALAEKELPTEDRLGEIGLSTDVQNMRRAADRVSAKEQELREKGADITVGDVLDYEDLKKQELMSFADFELGKKRNEQDQDMSFGDKMIYRDSRKDEYNALGTMLQAGKEMIAGTVEPVYDFLEHAGDWTNWEGLENLGAEGLKNTAEYYANGDKKMKGLAGEAAALAPQTIGMVIGALTRNPTLMKVATGVQIGSSMGQAAHEAKEAGAGGGQIFASALVNGAIEYGTERIPLQHWLKKVSPTVGRKVVSEATEEALSRETDLLLDEARKTLGNKLTVKTASDFAKGLLAEGGSEYAAEFLQTFVPLIYESPEKYPTLWDAIKEGHRNGVQGFRGGVMMASVINPAASYSQRRAHDARRREQGYVDIAAIDNNGKTTIVEILGVDQKGDLIGMKDGEDFIVDKNSIKERKRYEYNFFKYAENELYKEIGYENTMPEAVDGNAVARANKVLRDAENAAKTALGLESDTSIEDFIGDRSVDEVAMGDESVAEALDTYFAEKAKYEGMQDKMQDTREGEYMEADKSVDAVAHEDGNVYSTTLPETGETIFITGGKVVLDNEGYIDVNQSEGLVALMPNSKKEAIKAGNIRDKVVVENAQAQKAAKRAEIDARYKQQLNTFTYTDKVDGAEHTVQLVSRGEQMARVILDGVEQDIPNNVFDEVVAEATGENGEVAQAVPAVEGQNAAPVVQSETTQPVEQPELSNAEQLPKEKQAPTPIPMEKRGKEERAAYHLVPIERTMEDLHDGTLEPDEIEGLIDARIKEAENDVKNVEKKKPVIGADKNAYVAAKQQWQADMEAAKAKFDYYNQLKAINAEVTRSEMREAVEAVEPQVLIEQTPDEFVANQLGGFIKITPESFQKETGLKTEQKQMVGVIAGKDKGGVTVEQAAEIILENYGDELRGLGFNGDMQDMRDMIINILSNGNPRSYAKKGAEMRAQESVDEQMSQLEGVAIGMGFKDTNEMIAYEEAVVPRIIQDYTGFDETEYFNNLAENIEYDTTRESEGTRGSSELLQGEQSADNAGTGNVAEPGQGGEIQGDVYSGGENAAPQGNQQVSSSEIPNNQNRDNVSPVEGAAEGEVKTESGEVKTENAPSEADAPGQGGVTATLIKGAKWENTGEPDKIKSSRKKGDSHDITWYIGKKKYGSTTAERDLLVVLAEDYRGDLNAVWNAYEQGEVLLSANEAAILKKLIETNTSVAELQQGTLELDRENPAFGRATENVRKKLEATGVKVKVLTKEEAEKALAELEAISGVERMAVSEAKKRADEIKNITALPITSKKRSKEELLKIYKQLKPVKKGGENIEFFHGVFGKAWHGEDSMFAKIVPYLREIFTDSKLAYSEVDTLGGSIRKDGTIHKKHPNIIGYHNYVGKVNVDGIEYYVRFTVQEEKSGKQGTHSFFVSEVALYENPHSDVTTDTKNHLGKTSSAGIVDAKLKDFFDYANGITNIPEFMTVFHGSGAKFDKFDHSFMGSGEGAQAYGWGTYVTEVEGIGKQYANSSNQLQKLRGMEFERDRIKKDIEFWENRVGYFKSQDNDNARSIVAQGEAILRSLNTELATVNKQIKESGIGRNLYTVEIPDDNGSNYLHWEDDMTDAQIADIIEKLPIEKLLEGMERDGISAELPFVERVLAWYEKLFPEDNSKSGESIYTLAEFAFGGDKAASQFLNDMGFVGISYPAEATTGGRADGARNYVIFNENDAQIESRIEFLRTSDGTTYGWAVNGTIYLTPEGLNPNTPIHEYTHLWAAALQKSNPKLWGEVVEAMKLSPAWNEVMADDNYTDIHGDENRVASEVLSRLSGNEGYRRYMEQAEAEIAAERNIGEKVRKKGALNFFKRIWNKFQNWLQSVFKSGKVKAGDSTEAKAEPWDVFVNKSLKDFDEGVSPDAKDSPLDRMFIGKKGAENLDKAEEATTRLDNLNVAREMEAGGKDARAIKLATGWERGAGGKWRYETEDVKVNRGAELFSLETYKSYPIAGPIEIGRVDENSTIKLADLVKDDELFKAYPEMEEYYVSFEKMPAETEGSHSFEEKMIRINKNDIHSLGSTLVHEIQHAVQSLEGFAKGGNTTSSQGLIQEVLKTLHVDSNYPPTLSEVISAVENGYITKSQHENLTDIAKSHGYSNAVDYVRSLSPYLYYNNLTGEVESRNVEERMNYTEEQRRNSLAEETEDVSRKDQIFIFDNLGVSANEEVTSGKKITYDEAKKESAVKPAVKNSANFVSTYKTEDGKDINYTSERAEGYGIQGGGTGNSYDGTGHSILQRQTDTGVPGGNSGLNTEKGEFCVVERVFTENGAFNFTSGEKIESADDVAYIFSALEDAAKEHSFVVYVKDGKPTVVELGMGSFNATMVDIPTASLAYSRISPDHVYFVHNHPSGNLICSDLDVKMLREFEGISDVPVTGVIINLKTGKYGTFDTERHSAIGEKRVPKNEERLTVHTLDKQIFAPDYDPMAQPLVRSSQDVAQFLNSQRMGDRPKVSFLILSRANRIIGNIHTPFTDITTDVEAVARYINERIIQFGGENAVLYGDFAISHDEAGGFRLLQNAMERFGKTKLLDVVRVEGNFTKSANDYGFLYEPEADYGVVKESDQGYGSTEQDIPVGEDEVVLTGNAVAALGEKLNIPTRVVNDVESLPENKRNKKGWVENGEVVVVMDNHVSMEDAMQTVLHEVVGRDGLRAVMGEEFNALLDIVYRNLPKSVKSRINYVVMTQFVTPRQATEEYIAGLAGKGDVSDDVKQWMRDYFRNEMNLEVEDGELQYMLWKNIQRLQTPTVVSMVQDSVMEAETNTGDNGTRFRTAGDTAKDAYEKNVRGRWNKVKEGHYDRLRSVRKALEAIADETGMPISDSEDVYSYAEHLPSINKIMKEQFDNKFLTPFIKLLKRIYDVEFNGKKLDEKSVERYTNAKHGLERNRDMAVANALTTVEEVDGKKKPVFNKDAYEDWQTKKAAILAENITWEEKQDKLDALAKTYGAKLKDYSGLTAIFDPEGKMKYKQLRDEAIKYVTEMEGAVGKKSIDELWKIVKGMTDFSLKQSYESGLLSKDMYESISKRYEFYVPLRGFTEETAEDYYDYLAADHTPLNSVIKRAEGRKSEADNIFATILNMANSAIVFGNKNRLKQRVLNLATRHKSSLLSVDRAWYEKKGEDVWELALPVTNENMTEEQLAQAYADFEADMKRKEALGEAERQKEGLNIKTRVISDQNKAQHAIRVKRNGREYIVWVNASPTMANAVNGMLREEETGWALNAIDAINKFRSKMVTQFSPTFVLTNLSRDVQGASTVYGVRYGAKALGQFEMNVMGNSVKMMGLYAKFKKGTLDESVPLERYFKEFLENGGETGYTEMISIEEYNKALNKLTEKLNIKNATGRALEAVGEGVEFANRCVENLCRFSAYMTSRENGISILQSVNDAKEVSVNFNRKGSGAMGAGVAKRLFMFYNPAVQALVQRYLLAKNYPKRMIPVLAGEFALGAMQPILFATISALASSALDDDDDETWEEKFNRAMGRYYNLTDYRRRGSVCLPLGDGVFNPPLAHESRVFFGLGELAMSWYNGHETYDNIPAQAMDIIGQSLPLNPVEGWAQTGNLTESLLLNLTPDALKPFAENAVNRDFAGNKIHNASDMNAHLPEYMRGKKSTAEIYNRISKLLSGGESDFERGFLDDNASQLANPSKLEHLVEGYLGGAYTFAEKLVRSASWAMGNEENADARNIPFVSSSYTPIGKYEETPSAERTRRDWERAFDYYQGEIKLLDGKEKAAKRGLKFGMENAAETLEAMQGGEALMVDVFNDGNKILKELYADIDAARTAKDFDKVKEIDQEIYAQKRFITERMEQMVENPAIGYTFKTNKSEGAYGERETYGDVRDMNIINEFQRELKPLFEAYVEELKTLGEIEQLALYQKNEKMVLLYNTLKEKEQLISYEKSKMKENPVYAEEGMTEIRTLRAEAVELINKYRNE